MVSLAGWAIRALIGGAIAGRLVFGLAEGRVEGLDLLVGGAVVILLMLGHLRRVGPAPEVSGDDPHRVAVPIGPAPDHSELDRGVRDVRRTDPGFDPVRFAGYAGMVFREAERAWTTGDIDALGDRVTPELLGELRAQYDRGRSTRRASRADQIEIRAEITEVWQEGGRDYLTAHVGGAIVTAGEAGAGGAHAITREIDEFWTFTRPAGLNPWMLSAIEAP